MPQTEKREIHAVFLRFPVFAWEQNPSLSALADGIRASKTAVIGEYLSAEYEKEGIHMSDAINLQEAILKEVRRDKVPVTLFLMNGFQLRGIITGFDSFVVVLVTDGKQQMIYKHAISTLAPIRPLKAAAPSL